MPCPSTQHRNNGPRFRGEKHEINLKILHQAGFETARQAATSTKRPSTCNHCVISLSNVITQHPRPLMINIHHQRLTTILICIVFYFQTKWLIIVINCLKVAECSQVSILRMILQALDYFNYLNIDLPRSE